MYKQKYHIINKTLGQIYLYAKAIVQIVEHADIQNEHISVSEQEKSPFAIVVAKEPNRK